MRNALARVPRGAERDEAARLECRLAQMAEENDTLREINRQLRDALVATDAVLPTVPLTKFEATVLGMLMARSLVTKEALTVVLYGDSPNDPPDPKIFDTIVCKIRAKFARSGIPATIETVWGQGWRLSPATKRALKSGAGR